MSKQLNQYKEGLTRVSSLLALYEKLAKENRDKDARATDILRAAVVLLHASEEDYLRNVLIQWYPVKADPAALKEVPLAGTTGREAKFTFDKLASFRGETVDELIDKSVREYFSKISFNSYTEIVGRLRKLQIEVKSYERQSDIDALIARRHKIVHEVDLTTDNSGKTKTAPIRAAQVRTWVECSQSLIEQIDSQIDAWESNLDGLKSQDLISNERPILYQ